MTSVFDNITVTGSGGFSGSPAPAGGLSAVTASTGLVAAISVDEFERLVRDAVDAVVLRTTVKLNLPVDKKRAPNGAATSNGYRYVFPCAGIVFVTTTSQRISLGTGVREVGCLAIVHDGKPLGRDDGAI